MRSVGNPASYQSQYPYICNHYSIMKWRAPHEKKNGSKEWNKENKRVVNHKEQDEKYLNKVQSAAVELSKDEVKDYQEDDSLTVEKVMRNGMRTVRLFIVRENIVKLTLVILHIMANQSMESYRLFSI